MRDIVRDIGGILVRCFAGYCAFSCVGTGDRYQENFSVLWHKDQVMIILRLGLTKGKDRTPDTLAERSML